jgi:hypothetical protein
MLTLGYLALKPSAQNVIRLFSVSEPMEFTFPEIPLTTSYGGRSGDGSWARRLAVRPSAKIVEEKWNFMRRGVDGFKFTFTVG